MLVVFVVLWFLCSLKFPKVLPQLLSPSWLVLMICMTYSLLVFNINAFTTSHQKERALVTQSTNLLLKCFVDLARLLSNNNDMSKSIIGLMSSLKLILICSLLKSRLRKNSDFI